MTACKQVKGKPRTPENNIDQSIVISFVALSEITLMKNVVIIVARLGLVLISSY